MAVIPARAENDAASPVGRSQHWDFIVSLDGKPIGHHEFTVTGAPDEADVITRARFRVRAVGIPVFHYEHDDHESWRGGCLERMDAHTDDDGKETTVHANREPAGLAIEGPGGRVVASGCVHSFAYWDRALLSDPQLLNAQTGKLESVTTTDLGQGVRRVAGQDVPAHHYSLQAETFRIDLWYSDSGRWIALESRMATGRTLRYDLQAAPD